MTERVRVYHPTTDEPFDVTVSKAADLRLNHGWRSQPLDPSAEPAVTEIPVVMEEGWRGTSEAGEEVVEEVSPPIVTRRSPRVKKASTEED